MSSGREDRWVRWHSCESAQDTYLCLRLFDPSPFLLVLVASNSDRAKRAMVRSGPRVGLIGANEGTAWREGERRMKVPLVIARVEMACA